MVLIKQFLNNYARVDQFYPPTRCQKSTCTLYTSAHYNQEVMVWPHVHDAHCMLMLITVLYRKTFITNDLRFAVFD